MFLISLVLLLALANGVKTQTTEDPYNPTPIWPSYLFNSSEYETIGLKGNLTFDGQPKTGQTIPTPEVTQVSGYTDYALNISDSKYTLSNYQFPLLVDIVNGNYSSLENKSLKLNNITRNRIGDKMTETFKSRSNVYRMKINDLKKLQFVFNVSGNGKMTVTLKSLINEKFPSKVLTVDNNVAAFSFEAVDGYMKQDRIVGKVENDANEKIFFYLVLDHY